MRNDRYSKTSIILYALLVLPVVWAAVFAAPHLWHGGLPAILEGLTAAMEQPFHLTWVAETPKTILLFLAVYAMGIGIYLSSTKNYRRGIEHGSAKWGNVHSINRKYEDKSDPLKNKLVTQHLRIGLDGKKHRRNLHILVAGGSGAGKTRFFAKPNVLNACGHQSLIVLDPKNEILRATGGLLESEGYDIKVLDLINMGKSHCYNPFVYLKDDKDVLMLVTNLIRNTTPKGANSNDPFWERSETALLESLILYLLSCAPPSEQNFPMVMELLAAAEVREDNEDYASPLDELFERLEMDDPSNLAVRQYKIFKLAAGKTAKSILVSLGVRLEKFNLNSLAAITQGDDLDLAHVGDKKTAIFAVIPDNDSSLNFIVGMLYTQLFQQLYYQADHVHGGSLPYHVHFIMDEFANIALPDEYDKLLSTMRSRNISCSIIIQNLAQLKALFKDSWESIVGNCDCFLYLGGNEQSTHEYVSKLLGKETLDTNTYGKSQGRNGSYSTNYQQSGRELYTSDEVRMLDNQYALAFIRGELPIQDTKIDLLKHSKIAFTEDGGAPPYEHGRTHHAVDWRTVALHPKGEYVLLCEEDMQELYAKKENTPNETQ